MAGGDGEVVDEFEDEEAGKGAAEVGDAVEGVSRLAGLGTRWVLGDLRSK